MTPFFIAITLLITLISLPSAGVVASWVGGWSKLAKVYPCLSPYEGETVLCSGGMGIAHYGFSLLAGGNYSGLFLKTAPWIRAGHPPLLIPWEDMKAEESQGFFYPRVLVTFTQCPGVTFRMPKKDALKVRALPDCEKAFQGIS